MATSDAFTYKSPLWPFVDKWSSLGKVEELQKEYYSRDNYYNSPNYYEFIEEYHIVSSYDFTEFMIYIFAPVIIFTGFYLIGSGKEETVEIKSHNQAAWLNEQGLKFYKEGKYQNSMNYLYKAYQIIPNDPILTKNIAALFSKMENKEKTYEYLRKAYKLGIDINSIKSSEAFDWITKQEDFPQFIASLKRENTAKKEDNEDKIIGNDIIEKLKSLSELKEKGIISESEFINLKNKLMN